MIMPLIKDEELPELLTKEFKEAIENNNPAKIKECVNALKKRALQDEEVYGKIFKILKTVHNNLLKYFIPKLPNISMSDALHSNLSKYSIPGNSYSKTYEIDMNLWKKELSDKTTFFIFDKAYIALLTYNKSYFENIEMFYKSIKKPQEHHIKYLISYISKAEVLADLSVKIPVDEIPYIIFLNTDKDKLHKRLIGKIRIVLLQHNIEDIHTMELWAKFATAYNSGHIAFAITHVTESKDTLEDAQLFEIPDIRRFVKLPEAVQILKTWIKEYKKEHGELPDIDFRDPETIVRAIMPGEVTVYHTDDSTEQLSELIVSLVKNHKDIQEYFYDTLYQQKPSDDIENDVKQFLKVLKPGRGNSGLQILLSSLYAAFSYKLLVVNAKKLYNYSNGLIYTNPLAYIDLAKKYLTKDERIALKHMLLPYWTQRMKNDKYDYVAREFYSNETIVVLINPR